MTHYKAPGEHEVDGVKYFAEIPREGLDKIRKMSLYDDDVIIASYPKCGECENSDNSNPTPQDHHFFKKKKATASHSSNSQTVTLLDLFIIGAL